MSNYKIGIDVGGTKITGIVFDGKKAVKELTIVTPSGLEYFKRSFIKLLDFLSADYKISGVGIGMAGLVDAKKGKAVISPNIKYIKNFPVVEFVRKQGFKNVAVDNDARCFLLAETQLGAAKRFKNAFGLIVGTGVGGAMILDGRNYRGSDNFGGEIGNWLVDAVTLEKAYQLSKQHKDYKRLTQIFSSAFANIINLLTPQCIVVGGTYGQLYHKQFLAPALKKALQEVRSQKTRPKLIISSLKHSGAIGAALLTNLIK